ncbi:MAG: hypothetical protein CSA33_08630 [Desulfobulbus propionicus]|nr:MAG: hypothetical protein CSA33_08630 [Desulfobulbus propionicus]
MTGVSRDHILAEEALIVRHSGELPEVILHASLAYLCEDREGPRLQLAPEERAVLEQAARERYLEIVCRDLEPDNRDLSMFRGMQRAYVNWQRLLRFCERVGDDPAPFIGTVADCVLRYLCQELEDVSAGRRTTSLNCSPKEVLDFIRLLGLVPADLPEGWEQLC